GGGQAWVGWEGQEGERPQGDRVVGDDVRHRRGRELLAQLPQLLAGGLVVGPGAAAVVRGRLVSTVRLVLTARRPKGAHADILTSSHQSWEVGPAFAAFPTRPTCPGSAWDRARVRCHGRPRGRTTADF